MSGTTTAYIPSPPPQTLTGTAGSDSIQGSAERDFILGVPREALSSRSTVWNAEPNHVLADQETGADLLLGNGGDDVIFGGGGNDTINGGEGRDQIDGGAGRDVMTGGPGPDLFVFGYPTLVGRPPQTGVGDAADRITDWTAEDGFDLRAYWNFAVPGVEFLPRGPLAYGSGKLEVGYRHEGPNTVVMLWDGHTPRGTPTAEIVLENVLLDARPSAITTPGSYYARGPGYPAGVPPADDPYWAPATRLYDTVFNRPPDGDGLAFWAEALRAGYALDVIADLFITAPEFQATYGALDNRGFVRQLYRNVLDREGEQEGVDHWARTLDNRLGERADIVLGFSEAPEHVAKMTAEGFLV